MNLEQLDLAQFDDVIEAYPNDPTVKYAMSVLTGEKLAGDLIQRASLRHLNDLQRQWTDENFPYEYSQKRTEEVIKFSGLLRDLESHDLFVLSPYQEFIVGMLEGWVDPRVKGSKRFDRAYISMARANGKTAIMAVLALYNFIFGQPDTNRQLAVASADTAHADALYKYMRSQWTALKDNQFKAVQRRLKVEDNKIMMTIPSQDTTMKKLSAQSAPSDGIGHFGYAIVDEYHIFKERSFINSITSGQAFMPFSQIIFISTAGVDLRSPMYADYKRFKELYEKQDYSTIENSLFLFWQQDSDGEVDSPDTWIKSNPLFELEDKRVQATQKLISERDELSATGKLPDFITKNMNRFVNAKNDAFLSAQRLEDIVIPDEDFDITGRDVFIGMDFSATNDDSALGFVFPYIDNEGKQKYHLYGHYFIPWERAGSVQAKSKQDGINYEDSELKGYSTISTDEFGQINQRQIFEWLTDFIETNHLQVKAITYDAWNSKEFIDRLDTAFPEYLTLPVKQTIPQLYQPTSFLRNGVIRGEITRFEDEVMMVGLSNAVTVGNVSGYKIDKNTRNAKIDVVDAIVNALYEGMYYFDGFTNVEEPKKKSMFDGMSADEINGYYLKLKF